MKKRNIEKIVLSLIFMLTIMAQPVLAQDNIDSAPYMMPGGYTLSEEEIEYKKNLSEHIDDIESLTPNVDYVEGEFIVLTDTEEEAQDIASAYGMKLLKYDTGVATLCVDDNVQMDEILKEAASLDNNLPAVWVNGIRYADSYNDPFLSAASEHYQWQHGIVGSYDAWKYGYTGAGIKVAVLDSGVLNGHEDLPEITALGCDAQDLTGAGSAHGTHVAGIIGAIGNNGKGGSGIAPSVTLYSGCVIPNGSGNDATILAGINKAAEADVDVINMSLGGIGYTEAFDIAITRAYNKGIAVFVSSGNNGGNNYNYPATCKDAITISATNPDGSRAFFSNYGKHVELSTPGVNIYSTSSKSATSYESMSGTSQAAPVASGMAAVILGADQSIKSMPKTSGKVDALVSLMQKSATSVPSSGMGAGVPNLVKALDLPDIAQTPNAPEIIISNVDNDTKVEIKAQQECTIYYRTDGKNPTFKNGMIDTDDKTYIYNTPFVISPYININSIKAIAVNKAGLVSAVSTKTLDIDTKVTNISVLGTTNIAKGKSSQFTAQVYPLTAKNRSVTWSIYSDGSISPLDINAQKNCGVSISTSGKVTVTGSANVSSKYKVVATAKDGSNVEGSCIITITDSVKVASVKFLPNSISMKIGENKTPVVEAFCVDKTAAKLTDFVWTTNNQEVAIVDSNGLITATGEGKAVIKAVANDSSGKYATLNVTVNRLAEGLAIEGSHIVAAGRSIQLKAKITPNNVTSKAIAWSITGAEGLKISAKGRVSTTSKTPTGEYTVTAKTTDGSDKTGTFSVMVTSGGITKLSLADSKDKKVTIFREGGLINAPTAKPVYLNIDGSNKNCYEALSSNPGIVNVSCEEIEGKQAVVVSSTGVATGKSVVTVKSTDGTNKTIKINVIVNNPASKIIISLPSGKTPVVAQGKSLKLNIIAEAQYGRVSKPPVEWSVIDGGSDVTINSKGVLKASKNAATAKWYTVQAKATDGTGLVDKYSVYVCTKTTYIYILSSRNLRVKPGYTFRGMSKGKKYASVIDSNAMVRNFTCTSSNPSVVTASIKNDNKTNKCYLELACDNPGRATVTIKSYDGCKTVKYSFVVK